jgi:hypothetical protein
VRKKTDTAGFNLLSIGTVFTPLKWAHFAITEFDLFTKWMNGATIFDPTMGEGHLLEALITFGLQKGVNLKELPVDNLYGVEMNTSCFETCVRKMKSTYGIRLSPHKFVNGDIFSLKNEQSFDIVFGNPPWQNFVDLPDNYKEELKPKFFTYDLIGNSQDLLLGGSRIDIAALVIQKVMQQNLKKGGEAIFFMPLSLLLNDGANQHFRTYKVNSTPYYIDKIYDFNNADIFSGIATRYGLVHFKRDSTQVFPVPYRRWEEMKWVDYFSKPMFHPRDPLSVFSDPLSNSFDNFEFISIKKDSVPRQGVNTCGANHVFFFDSYTEVDEVNCSVSNKVVTECLLPKKYVFPLITSHNFKNGSLSPIKWVLLPYNTNGKALELSQIRREKKLESYLISHKEILENRKGVMLNALIKRGNWWSLLGVGDYSFYPYKIVWEAYGRTEFHPKIFKGGWQANQSLQAFIPVKTMSEAKRILGLLKDKRVEEYLLSLKMEGTMNWAQPGKIKKLVKFEEETMSLF